MSGLREKVEALSPLDPADNVIDRVLALLDAEPAIAQPVACEHIVDADAWYQRCKKCARNIGWFPTADASEDTIHRWRELGHEWPPAALAQQQAAAGGEAWLADSERLYRIADAFVRRLQAEHPVAILPADIEDQLFRLLVSEEERRLAAPPAAPDGEPDKSHTLAEHEAIAAYNHGHADGLRAAADLNATPPPAQPADTLRDAGPVTVLGTESETITAPGWYYYDSEYSDEGSCGPFDTQELALAAGTAADEGDAGNVSVWHFDGDTLRSETEAWLRKRTADVDASRLLPMADALLRRWLARPTAQAGVDVEDVA